MRDWLRLAGDDAGLRLALADDALTGQSHHARSAFDHDVYCGAGHTYGGRSCTDRAPRDAGAHGVLELDSAHTVAPSLGKDRIGCIERRGAGSCQSSPGLILLPTPA